MRAISASARCAFSVSVLLVCAMSAPPRADLYHTRGEVVLDPHRRLLDDRRATMLDEHEARARRVPRRTVSRTGRARCAAEVAAHRVECRHPERAVTKGEASMANVLTVVAKIRAAKGKGDALAALLAEQAGVVRKADPGCLVYRPHRSTKDPDLFIFYEMYKDDAAFDVHRKAQHLAAYRERREKEGLTEGPPEVEIYRSLTE